MMENLKKIYIHQHLINGTQYEIGECFYLNDDLYIVEKKDDIYYYCKKNVWWQSGE